MELFSSDEEDCELPFWSDWSPPSELPLDETDSSDSKEVSGTSVTNIFPLGLPQFSSISKDARCGKWIPPSNLTTARAKGRARSRPEKSLPAKAQRSSANGEALRNCGSQKSSSECENTNLREGAVFDFGKRVELHDVTSFNDGDLIWGVVNLGVFAEIKLWINEYSNICASADGTICKLGSSESTIISIKSAELLREMLGLSTPQWTSLCESMQAAEVNLKFDALQDFQFSGKSNLEKIWFLICKRRHFLPDQCMLVKLSGAVKCMKEFKIIPKIVVQEIKIS